jgi:hypothetical protein
VPNSDTPLSLHFKSGPVGSKNVFLFSRRDLMVLSGTFTLNSAKAKNVSLAEGQVFNVLTGEITKLAPDAPERKLWP